MDPSPASCDSHPANPIGWAAPMWTSLESPEPERETQIVSNRERSLREGANCLVPVPKPSNAEGPGLLFDERRGRVSLVVRLIHNAAAQGVVAAQLENEFVDGQLDELGQVFKAQRAASKARRKLRSDT